VLRLALPALAAAAIVGALVLTNTTLRHLVTAGGGTYNSGGNTIYVAPPDMRFQIWRRTLHMIGDHPLGGVGPGNFQRVFESVYNPEVNSDGRRGVHAHNAWLQQFGEMGLPGGIAYTILWAAVLWVGWRRAVEVGTFATVGSLLALVAMAGTNLLTNMFFMIDSASGRLYSLCWVLFGLIAAPTTDPRRPGMPDVRA
jgi:O-antigen ligase